MSEQVTPSAAPVEAAPMNVENQESKESLESQEAEVDASEEAEAKEKEEAPAKKQTKTEKEIEKRIKKLKLKVDGKEIEEELDLDNEEELIRHLQMSKMGQKRAQEKAQLEKELQSFFGELQRDPLSLLAKEMGMDVNQLIQSYIDQQLEQAQKSPEQIEREKLESELKALRDEREKEKETLKTRELERLQQQEFERYDMLMDKALSASTLPKSPYVVKKLADYMLVGLEAGYDVTPEDVIPLVEQELNTDLQELFQSLPEDRIEGLLGEQVLNKLRKRRISKAKEAQAAVAKPAIADTGKSNEPKPKESKDKKSFKDFFGV